MLRTRSAGFPILLSLLLFLLAASCTVDSDEEESILQPFSGGGPPILPVPMARLTPGFATHDSLARYAKGMVIGQLNRIRMVSQAAVAAHATLNGDGWRILGSSCRSRVIGAAADTACTYTLWVCASNGGFEWSEVLNGPCIPRVAHFQDWERFSGFTSEDGNSGSFRTYRSGSTSVSEAWSWRMSADRTVGDWEFSRGPRVELFATMHWEQGSGDLVRGEFVWDGDRKWDAEIATDGRSGRMTLLDWDYNTDTWVRRDEIIWVPAHGTWNTYDTEANLLEGRVW